MSFPKTLADELGQFGCEQSARLSFALPEGAGEVAWHVSFRALGFAKNQIDGALQYRHPQATDFGWKCLANYAGARWRDALRDKRHPLSGGFAVGPIAGWRSDHTFDNQELSQVAAAKLVARDIREKVMPFVANFSAGEQLLALLTEDEEPYPWFRSQGLTRVAEIACLEGKLGDPTPGLLKLVERHQVLLQDQLDGVELSEYIEKVLMAVPSAA